MRINSRSLASLSGPRASLTRTAFSPRLDERVTLRVARARVWEGARVPRVPLQDAQSRTAEDAHEERSPREKCHEARVSTFIAARAALGLTLALVRALCRRRARREGRARARGVRDGRARARGACDGGADEAGHLFL